MLEVTRKTMHPNISKASINWTVNMARLVMIIVFLSMSMVWGGRLIKRPNGWFITGRGCGGSKKIEYLGSIPENPASLECVFIPKDPMEFVRKLTDYSDRCIHYDKTPNTYANGKAVCESLFGRVYEPRDEDRARKVYAYAASVGYLAGTTHHNIGAPWIGIGDAATESEFVYDSDGKPPKFNHFFTDQPNNSHPGGSQCVALWAPWDNTLNPWNDVQCTDLYGTLCELDAAIAKAHGKECLFF